ncbi:MAG: HAMP domain-containing sensor histidine kinase, partial [Candidatus Moraniibacteriota bacterium]
MSLWSIVYLLQALILACTWYFAHAFLDEKDVSLQQKMIMGILLLPLIVFLPTTWNLSGFDVVNCEATPGLMIKYFYFFQGVGLLWIFGYLINKYRKTVKKIEKKKVAIFSLGISFFLVAFAWGNAIGNLTLEWSLEQYGLFGMPVFIGFLAFLIVRYKAFDIKLIGAQALVISLATLIGSQFFFIQNNTNRILTGITLSLVGVFGWVLIRSVKEEVRQKEELEKISHTLAVVNERLKELDATKSEFISIASHQLRTPLTAIKGYISLLLEGSYGVVSPQVLDILNKLYSVNNRLVHLVEDLLNVSRIEAGRIQYSFAPTQLEPIITELVDMFRPTAKDKGLTLEMNLLKNPLPLITIDPNKIKEVLSNLIDNSLKYTVKGGTTISLESTPTVARIIVSDTGIGIHPEDKKNLFEKFLRSKETTRMVVSGAGLGLYVGKSFVEAHGGKIWAESPC